MTYYSTSLLDTSVVIDFPAEAVNEHAATHSISSVTLAELAYGMHAPDIVETSRRQERFVRVRSTFDILPFDEHCAHLYGALSSLVRKIGRAPKPRRMDLLIAAVAGTNQLPLLTRNPKDFVGLETAVKVIGV
ncbi:type II toxin-antitoxin system VapC family toxin [Haloactinomyces albus]|uniref:Nucleic acid-binding protein n=1 Tax=Haloactinomyces albus TaxID=1352928 RepID=A0AAE3ZB34_9ACTN|nr:type II toxin-antitoxin system VapC family toxin [Haloactinomyces albus]MDR7301653.1 putative nucleic acid-binding protein [Haloactinomyces albus]